MGHGHGHHQATRGATALDDDALRAVLGERGVWRERIGYAWCARCAAYHLADVRADRGARADGRTWRALDERVTPRDASGTTKDALRYVRRARLPYASASFASSIARCASACVCDPRRAFIGDAPDAAWRAAYRASLRWRDAHADYVAHTCPREQRERDDADDATRAMRERESRGVGQDTPHTCRIDHGTPARNAACAAHMARVNAPLMARRALERTRTLERRALRASARDADRARCTP